MANLLGGGGRANGVTDLAGGLTGGGGPLDGVTGLAGGLTGGLGGGLLGGSEGLNVAGLVGVGSDEKALLDLNPAEKKEVKAQKIQQAQRREQARQQEKAKLQQMINQQGGRPTSEQQKKLNELDVQKAADDADLAKINQLIPDDPASAGPVGGLKNPASSGIGGVGDALGGSGPLNGATSGLTGVSGASGVTSAANGLTGASGPSGALGNVSNAAGGLAGAGTAGGPLGGLLGSGSGLNVAGLVGVGSDDPALLDLNPQEKKEAKAKRVAEYNRRRQERELRQKELERLLRQKGSLTEAQRAEYDRLTREDAHDRQQVENFGKWIDQPSSAAATAGAGNGSRVGYGPNTNSYSPSSSCIPICPHTEDRYASSTGLFYAYLVDAERQDPSKPSSYLMTFANASVAKDWFLEVDRAGYKVTQAGPQFYSFRGQAPYPVSYEQRLANSDIGHRMMIQGMKKDNCQMIIPPQTSLGYLVGPEYNRVAIVNRPCHICGAGGATSGSAANGSAPPYGGQNLTNPHPSYQGPSNGGGNYPGPDGQNSGSKGQQLAGGGGRGSNHSGHNAGGFGWQPSSGGGHGLDDSGRNPGGLGQRPLQTGSGNSFPGGPFTTGPGGQGPSGQSPMTGCIPPHSGQQGLGNTGGNHSYGGWQTGTGGFATGWDGSNPVNTKPGPGSTQDTGNQTQGSLGGVHGMIQNPSTTAGGASSSSGGGSSGRMSLWDAAKIAAADAKRKGDTRPEEDVARDIYGQLKGSCCNSSNQGGGNIVPATSTGNFTSNLPGAFPGSVPTSQGVASGGLGGAAGGLGSTVGGLTGGGLGGAVGGLGSTLGGLTGGLGGLGGGLLGSGQGLNVAGILAIGSDDPALLDLNPAEKKAVKQQRIQNLEKAKQQQDQKIQALQEQVRRQGGQVTPQQQQEYNEAIKVKQAAESTQADLTNSLAADGANGLGGLTGGLTGDLTQGGLVGGLTQTAGGLTGGLPGNLL